MATSTWGSAAGRRLLSSGGTGAALGRPSRVGLSVARWASGGMRAASTENVPVVARQDKQKERVVILGSGWAGYGFARTLDPDKFERIVISPRSYFVFTPLLASTSVGTLEFRSVLESVRALELDRFHQGWADDVDFSRKTIRVEANTSDDLASKTKYHLTSQGEHAPNTPGGPATVAAAAKPNEIFDVEYDKLVIAVGSYSQTFNTEGVREHANFLRDVGDARRIRLRVLQCFEKAALPVSDEATRKKLLHFAVVGGGPTGIEFAAELHDLIRDDLSRLYPELVDDVAITVYDVAPKVLPMFDQTLADYAMKKFMRDGISVRTQRTLQRIRPDPDTEGCLKLKIKEYGDQEVDAGIVVWSTGLMQNPFVRRIGQKIFDCQTLTANTVAEAEAQVAMGQVRLQRDPKTGGVITDAHLQVRVVSETSSATAPASAPLPDVFAIGDCAIVDGQPLPATAQVANQKATHLAKALNRGTVTEADFRFRNLGTMAYIGNWEAIHQSRVDYLKGWAAWILWRTAYLTKSMSARNKIMVCVYWAITWLFGRDISRF